MPLHIIEEDERLQFRHDESGAVFIYKRIPATVRGKIMQRHEKRGQLDSTGAHLDLLRWSLIDWSGIWSSTGEIPYDKKYVEYLPEDVRLDLMNAISSASPEYAKEERVKNSNLSSIAE